MAETRSQTPLNFVLTNETKEILESQLNKMKETMEANYAQIEDYYAQIGEEIRALRLLYRSRKGKKENLEDQALNDKELVETEVATTLIETEDRAVKNEANARMISAIDKEEPISQLQVPVSKLETSLRFHNASPDVCEDFKSLVSFDGLFDHVKARAVLLKKSASVTNNQAADYMFDKMSLRVQSKKRQIKCHKSWRFKFKQRKQQRGKLRTAHKRIYRGDVMYKYLCSNAKRALMMKNNFSTICSTFTDDCLLEDEQVYHETLPLLLLGRFKFWKFKFMHMNLQKMMRAHGYSNHLKLKSDVGEDDEMFTRAKAVSMRFVLGIMLGITESDASKGKQAMFEQIVMVNEWVQTSLVIQQGMRKFETSTDLLLLNGESLARTAIGSKVKIGKTASSNQEKSELCTENEEEVKGSLKRLHVWLMMKEETDSMQETIESHVMMDFVSKQTAISYFEGNSEFDTMLISLKNKQKQGKCLKSWMFKFRKKKSVQQLGYGYDLTITYLENKRTWKKLRVKKRYNLSWKEDASDESRSGSSRCIVKSHWMRFDSLPLRMKLWQTHMDDKWLKPLCSRRLVAYKLGSEDKMVAGFYRCVDNVILSTSSVKLLLPKNHKLLHEAEFCDQYNDMELSTEFQSSPAGHTGSEFLSVGSLHVFSTCSRLQSWGETQSERLSLLKELPMLDNDYAVDFTIEKHWFYNKPISREVFHLQRPPELMDLHGHLDYITKVLVQWKEHPPDQFYQAFGDKYSALASFSTNLEVKVSSNEGDVIQEMRIRIGQ